MKTNRKTQKSGWQQFTVGMFLYVGVVVATSFVSNLAGLSQPFKVVLALLPMIPAVWAMLGWIRAVRGFDELQQRILGEGLYWALGLTAALTFSYGFLESYADFPKLSMFFVWPVICVSFIFGQTLARRRYR